MTFASVTAAGHCSMSNSMLNQPALDSGVPEQFLQMFEHREHSRWRRLNFDLKVKWLRHAPKVNTRVRIVVDEGKKVASVLNVSLEKIGETSLPPVRGDHCFGLVRDDQTSVAVSVFGIEA